MERWAAGIVLALWALEDGRRKSVSRISLIAGGCFLYAAGLLCCGTETVTAGKRVLESGAGVLPGILLLLCARIWKRSVGTADGIVFLFLGPLLGFWKAFALLWVSLILFCLACAVLLLAGRITVKSRIAFLPFVFAGYLGCLLW